MKQNTLYSAFLGILAFGILLLASGCGGSSVNFSTWAGNYSGSGILDNNKNGVLTLVSDPTGLVTGTLVVTGADGNDLNFKFTAGTYALSGSITSTTGGFEVNGVVPNNGNFVVRGQFPTNGSSTTYRIVTTTSTTFINSLTYTGTLSKI